MNSLKEFLSSVQQMNVLFSFGIFHFLDTHVSLLDLKAAL